MSDNKGSSGQATDSRTNGELADNPFIELSAKVFMGTAGARVVAVVACHAGEGVTYVCEAMRSLLERDAGFEVSVRSADEFLALSRTESSRTLQQDAVAVQSAPQRKIVLVDCPALFSSATAVRVSSNVDGVLLVIKDGDRSKSEILRAVTMVEAVQGRVLGAILNYYRDALPGWLNALLS